MYIRTVCLRFYLTHIAQLNLQLFYRWFFIVYKRLYFSANEYCSSLVRFFKINYRVFWMNDSRIAQVDSTVIVVELENTIEKKMKFDIDPHFLSCVKKDTYSWCFIHISNCSIYLYIYFRVQWNFSSNIHFFCNVE